MRQDVDDTQTLSLFKSACMHMRHDNSLTIVYRRYTVHAQHFLTSWQKQNGQHPIGRRNRTQTTRCRPSRRPANAPTTSVHPSCRRSPAHVNLVVWHTCRNATELVMACRQGPCAVAIATRLTVDTMNERVSFDHPLLHDSLLLQSQSPFFSRSFCVW